MKSDENPFEQEKELATFLANHGIEDPFSDPNVSFLLVESKVDGLKADLARQVEVNTAEISIQESK